MRDEIHKDPTDGWVGGFAQSNPDFAYPNPDSAYPTPNLSSLEMKGNMENIGLLKRQQKVLWPEFSWNTEPDETDKKRCYQMFAPDISRLGYTDEGRVYSIICPQQGVSLGKLGNMNVEVTVTGNRGWANESNRELAADMSVVGKIWFSPAAKENKFVKKWAAELDEDKHPFPWDKEHAIVVKTHKPGDPKQPIFPLIKGESKEFPLPNFARHEGIKWTVGHLGVQIGSIVKTKSEKVNKFNQDVLDIFNLGAGNMLKEGNVLTWNVWFTAPELVVESEWQGHAELWRKSLTIDHVNPEGPGTKARFFDGTPFQPAKALFEDILEDQLPKILDFLKKRL
ncbi:MAG: hypothetical protein COB85_02320 [Bacteroidetes bacterium]|nr:MAG: hypothetical protein COB85_02320 [Bacteroidota bacterium]